ncbi:MAG: domain S-box protein [Candidatus Thermoplasmatota archaeon]|nr:domain S-box protein [Candidatus Thermoplasmatota archaeon]
MISVLLVDDEPQLLELTKFFVEKTDRDIRVATASSAKEAIAMMEAGPYDAIVCDYQMPGMDGLEFLKILRNQKNDIPFVLFTGKGREDVAIDALNSGADFYLQKGGDPKSQFAELASMIKASVATRRAEWDLAVSEERFRLLAENSKDIVFRYVLRPEPHYEYISPSVMSIVGHSPEDYYANPHLGWETICPDDRPLLKRMLEGKDLPSGPAIVRWRAKDGKEVWTEQRLTWVKDDAGEVVSIEGTAIDVTDRVKAEQDLKASEAHYRSIFETAGSAMVIIDEDGTLQSVNSLFEKLSGYNKAETEGTMRWDAFMDPSDAAKLAHEYMASGADPESVPRGYSFIARDKFGSEMALTAYAATVPGTGRTVVSIVDETERRRYEDAMQQVGKKMDLLARITRHDIMNQLAVLYGYLELAQERVADPDMQALLAKARSASESIKRHLEFARDYQNMGRKRPQWIDVQAAFRRAASNIELKGVRAVAELTDIEVFSDPMLEKVFYNLIDNSLKHGERTTKVAFSYSIGPEGMRLVYRDDGVGVPPSDKTTIFERSTADREGRRGYGLYLAREILGITGITLSETGAYGEGARFVLSVPRGKYRTKREPETRRHAKRPKKA